VRLLVPQIGLDLPHFWGSARKCKGQTAREVQGEVQGTDRPLHALTAEKRDRQEKETATITARH
jgi:hypothetical protein